MAGGTLILGAGFGGIVAALELKRLAPEEPVTLVDRADSFAMGLANLRVLDGRSTIERHSRKLALLEKKGVRVIQAEVVSVDPATRVVATSAGQLSADRLIVALGAKADLAGVAGLPTIGRNVYAADGAARLHADLAGLRDGCRVLFWAHSTPFKCPPAPYEAAALAKAFLRRRGVEAIVTIVTSEPHPLPVFPPEVGGRVKTLVEERGVVVKNGLTLSHFDGERAAVFSDGSRVDFDVLGIIPPHAPPPALAGLTGGSGFVEVDPRTLETRFADVWAVGDCTLLKLPSGKPIPKAGVLAEGEGLIVARNIAHSLHGEPAKEAWDGEGTCWIELGEGLAVEGRGQFFALPVASMRAGLPSREALAAKEAFERERLHAWFGA